MLLSVVHDVDSYASERFTLQYGSTGKYLTVPSGSTDHRAVFLGTLPLWVDRDNPEAVKMRLEYTTNNVSNGDVELRSFVVVPTMRSCTTMTGVSPTNYASFVPLAGYEKVVRHDLSGAMRRHMTESETPDTGLMGSTINLPPGEVDVCVWLPTKVIDTTDAASASIENTMNCWIGFEPQPRVFMVGQ
jgi:hypothetical protein